MIFFLIQSLTVTQHDGGYSVMSTSGGAYCPCLTCQRHRSGESSPFYVGDDQLP